MSIAEKLVAVAENQQKVFDAGRHYAKEKELYVNTSKMTHFDYFCSNHSLLCIIDKLDTGNGETFSHMFEDSYTLETIPRLDTSKGTDFSYMFNRCSMLTSIPQLNTSNGTKFTYMFHLCTELTSIPPLDTSKGISFYDMFNRCRKLKTIPSLDLSNCYSPGYMFHECYGLENITFKGKIVASLNMQHSPLTKESILSVMSALNGETSRKTLTLNKRAVDKAFEPSKGKADGSSSIEWLQLVDLIPSWTISLL